MAQLRWCSSSKIATSAYSNKASGIAHFLFGQGLRSTESASLFQHRFPCAQEARSEMPREHVDPDVVSHRARECVEPPSDSCAPVWQFLARLTACFPSSSTVVPASAAPPAGGRSKGKKSAAATAGDGNASARTAGAPSQPQDDVQVERKGGSVWLTHKRCACLCWPPTLHLAYGQLMSRVSALLLFRYARTICGSDVFWRR